MTYDEILQLEPRLAYFELDRIEIARRQKREGTFNADTFFCDFLKPMIQKLVGYDSGRRAADPLNSDEAYDRVMEYFANHPSFGPTPITPKTVVKLASSKHAIETEINVFLDQQVCRLISCEVKLCDGVFIAAILYIPY